MVENFVQDWSCFRVRKLVKGRLEQSKKERIAIAVANLSTFLIYSFVFTLNQRHGAAAVVQYKSCSFFHADYRHPHPHTSVRLPIDTRKMVCPYRVTVTLFSAIASIFYLRSTMAESDSSQAFSSNGAGSVTTTTTTKQATAMSPTRR